MKNIDGTPERCKKWVISIPQEDRLGEILSSTEIKKRLKLEGSAHCDCMGHYRLFLDSGRKKRYR